MSDFLMSSITDCTEKGFTAIMNSDRSCSTSTGTGSTGAVSNERKRTSISGGHVVLSPDEALLRPPSTLLSSLYNVIGRLEQTTASGATVDQSGAGLWPPSADSQELGGDQDLGFGTGPAVSSPTLLREPQSKRSRLEPRLSIGSKLGLLIEREGAPGAFSLPGSGKEKVSDSLLLYSGAMLGNTSGMAARLAQAHLQGLQESRRADLLRGDRTLLAGPSVEASSSLATAGAATTLPDASSLGFHATLAAGFRSLPAPPGSRGGGNVSEVSQEAQLPAAAAAAVRDPHHWLLHPQFLRHPRETSLSSFVLSTPRGRERGPEGRFGAAEVGAAAAAAAAAGAESVGRGFEESRAASTARAATRGFDSADWGREEPLSSKLLSLERRSFSLGSRGKGGEVSSNLQAALKEGAMRGAATLQRQSLASSGMGVLPLSMQMEKGRLQGMASATVGRQGSSQNIFARDNIIRDVSAAAQRVGLQVPPVCCDRFCSFFSVPCRNKSAASAAALAAPSLASFSSALLSASSGSNPVSPPVDCSFHGSSISSELSLVSQANSDALQWAELHRAAAAAAAAAAADAAEQEEGKGWWDARGGAAAGFNFRSPVSMADGQATPGGGLGDLGSPQSVEYGGSIAGSRRLKRYFSADEGQLFLARHREVREKAEVARRLQGGSSGLLLREASDVSDVMRAGREGRQMASDRSNALVAAVASAELNWRKLQAGAAAAAEQQREQQQRKLRREAGEMVEPSKALGYAEGFQEGKEQVEGGLEVVGEERSRREVLALAKGKGEGQGKEEELDLNLHL